METRRAMLEYLKRFAPVRLEEVAASLDIDQTAVLRHLNDLERQGFLDTKVVKLFLAVHLVDSHVKFAKGCNSR